MTSLKPAPSACLRLFALLVVLEIACFAPKGAFAANFFPSYLRLAYRYLRSFASTEVVAFSKTSQSRVACAVNHDFVRYLRTHVVDFVRNIQKVFFPYGNPLPLVSILKAP